MAKKIASMIKRMLAKETKPIRAKWYLDKETPETTPPTTNDQDSTAPRNKDPEIENEQTGTQNPEKPETTLQSLSSLSLEKLSGESRDQTAPTTKEKDDEIKADDPQPTKRQRKKPTPRDQGFLWST